MSEPSISPKIQVALVEDDVFFAGALADAILAATDMHLHGVAANCLQGFQMLNQPAADVLLVDLGLPDGPGMDIIRAAQRQWPRCMVMVSSVFGDEAHVIQSLEAGAAGYLLKDSTPTLLVEEIRSVHAGGSPISPLIARQHAHSFSPCHLDGVFALAAAAVGDSARGKRPLVAARAPGAGLHHQRLQLRGDWRIDGGVAQYGTQLCSQNLRQAQGPVAAGSHI
jgi:DNA-binding NarL/FixJ family response regulator